MKIRKTLVVATVAVLCASTSAAAFARGGHWHGGYRGFGWGLGLGLAVTVPYLLSRPYYYPPAVYAPAYYAPNYAPAYYEPPVYTQPAATVPVQAQAPAYYFCAASNGYYPYVRQCAGGWQVISSRPQGM